MWRWWRRCCVGPGRHPANVSGATAVGRRALFLGFLEIGLSGFGGVLPWARRVLVERRQWLSAEEFTEALGLAQALPGPNVVNVSIAIGHRFHGAIGSVLAFAGLMLVPLLIVLLLGVLYTHYGQIDAMRRILAGVAAAASGLVLATGIKMAAGLPRSWAPASVAVLAFIGAALWRLPLLGVLAVAAPVSVVLAWRRHR